MHTTCCEDVDGVSDIIIDDFGKRHSAEGPSGKELAWAIYPANRINRNRVDRLWRSRVGKRFLLHRHCDAEDVTGVCIALAIPEVSPFTAFDASART